MYVHRPTLSGGKEKPFSVELFLCFQTSCWLVACICRLCASLLDAWIFSLCMRLFSVHASFLSQSLAKEGVHRSLVHSSPLIGFQADSCYLSGLWIHTVSKQKNFITLTFFFYEKVGTPLNLVLIHVSHPHPLTYTNTASSFKQVKQEEPYIKPFFPSSCLLFFLSLSLPLFFLSLSICLYV